MNPHEKHPISIYSLFITLVKNRELIKNLAQREIAGRYRGSFLGIFWSFFNPVLMLIVYTFFFGVVFKARWSVSEESTLGFAMTLFSGLIVFNFFAECLGKSPTLILGNQNFVKKVIFPLEILPLATISAAGFHFLISFAVWLMVQSIFVSLPSLTIFLLPIVLLPLLLLVIGICWFVSATGVFLRDISQVVSVIISVLLFLTPIFYPVDALPEEFRGLMRLIPLTDAVEQARTVMIAGQQPDWDIWLINLLIASAVFYLGFAWFQKTRKGFADVL